ncbi:MAG: hypothetical protein KKB74_01815, partial [Bacteroidetes bacterium]|nr:hypothetical protein [Bacteroidota bacterium]
MENKGDIEVLAFDKDTQKLEFKKVFSFIRHKVNSKIYRVKLVGGRTIEITPYHSLFTFENGKVTPILCNNLKEGTRIIVPRKQWASKDTINSLDLIDELLKLNYDLTKEVYLYDIKTILKDKFIRKELRNVLKRKLCLYDYNHYNYMPFNILRVLSYDSINKIKEV